MATRQAKTWQRALIALGVAASLSSTPTRAQTSSAGTLDFGARIKVLALLREAPTTRRSNEPAPGIELLRVTRYGEARSAVRCAVMQRPRILQPFTAAHCAIQPAAHAEVCLGACGCRQVARWRRTKARCRALLRAAWLMRSSCSIILRQGRQQGLCRAFPRSHARAWQLHACSLWSSLRPR